MSAPSKVASAAAAPVPAASPAAAADTTISKADTKDTCRFSQSMLESVARTTDFIHSAACLSRYNDNTKPFDAPLSKDSTGLELEKGKSPKMITSYILNAVLADSVYSVLKDQQVQRESEQSILSAWLTNVGTWLGLLSPDPAKVFIEDYEGAFEKIDKGLIKHLQTATKDGSWVSSTPMNKTLPDRYTVKNPHSTLHETITALAKSDDLQADDRMAVEAVRLFMMHTAKLRGHLFGSKSFASTKKTVCDSLGLSVPAWPALPAFSKATAETIYHTNLAHPGKLSVGSLKQDESAPNTELARVKDWIVQEPSTDSSLLSTVSKKLGLA